MFSHYIHLFLYLILFLSFCFPASSQNKQIYHPEQLFSAEKIAKDSKILQTLLYNYHPNIFSYASQKQLDTLFTKLYDNEQDLNERELRIALRKIIAKIGCGHTNIIPSRAYMEFYSNNDYAHLPLEVQIIQNKVFITKNNSTDSSLTLGSELLSINGYPCKYILQYIFEIEGSDAYNQSYKTYEASLNFKYFCSLLFGMQDSFFVETKDQKGLIKIYQLFDKQEDNFSVSAFLLQQKYKKLKIDTLNKLAILKIQEFEGKKYKQFYKKTFKNLHTQNIKHLVIDLRDNGGGKIFDACQLLSYLLKQPFAYEFKRHNRKINFRKYMSDSKLFIGLMPFAFGLVAKKSQKNDSSIYKVIQKNQKKYNFTGQVYVLTNGGTFSAASFVAIYLQKLSQAILIGKETGGSQIGTNAMLFTTLTLPETKVVLRLPLYRINHLLPFEKTANGVIPNHEIEYSTQDFIHKKDKELEKVYELIQNNYKIR